MDKKPLIVWAIGTVFLFITLEFIPITSTKIELKDSFNEINTTAPDLKIVRISHITLGGYYGNRHIIVKVKNVGDASTNNVDVWGTMYELSKPDEECGMCNWYYQSPDANWWRPGETKDIDTIFFERSFTPAFYHIHLIISTTNDSNDLNNRIYGDYFIFLRFVFPKIVIYNP